ncbi:MAG: hypothetical protein AAFV71_03960 [Cyanobacteria bacterium J06633_8]
MLNTPGSLSPFIDKSKEEDTNVRKLLSFDFLRMIQDLLPRE